MAALRLIATKRSQKSLTGLTHFLRTLAPFKALKDAPFWMTAHIRYLALDADAPATCSPACLNWLREETGYAGMLLTDDLAMGALEAVLASALVQRWQLGVTWRFIALVTWPGTERRSLQPVNPMIASWIYGVPGPKPAPAELPAATHSSLPPSSGRC